MGSGPYSQAEPEINLNPEASAGSFLILLSLRICSPTELPSG